MGWLLRLAALTVGLAMIAACGSGGAPLDQDGEPRSTETPRSERVEREATVMQQEAAAGDAELSQSEPEDDQAQALAYGEIDFGHRAGLPFRRNVVGDPNAPVLIVEYSDFQ